MKVVLVNGLRHAGTRFSKGFRIVRLFRENNLFKGQTDTTHDKASLIAAFHESRGDNVSPQ